MELGQVGVWFFTDTQSAEDAATFAQRIESLGYAALWIPEAVGRHPFAHAAWILAKTSRLVVATGIASIYNRDPGATVAAANTLAEQSNNRGILGLGVSHQPMVEGEDAVAPHLAGVPQVLSTCARQRSVCEHELRADRYRYIHLRPRCHQLGEQKTKLRPRWCCYRCACGRGPQSRNSHTAQ